MKNLILVVTLVFSHLVFAEEADTHDSLPGVINSNFNLANANKKSVSDEVKAAVTEYLQNHKECLDQKYRYCEIYLPKENSSSDSVSCEEGYTFLTSGDLGFNIDRHSTVPKGMPKPTLEELLKSHNKKSSTGTFIGVCKKI